MSVDDSSCGVEFARLPDLVIETATERDFLRRWVDDNAHLGERRELLRRFIVDPTPRDEVARSLGMPLGRLLRAFNDTAPLGPHCAFSYRRVPFHVIAMLGTCDDVVGGRYPMFGQPVTLRCYFRDPPLPQGMLEAADWNFMDAGRPGFVGYAYGVRHEGTLYLAGLQSDLGVRYAYLFQGRGDTTDVRVGDDVVGCSAADMAARFGHCVPALRRTFQRYWIAILLAAALTWAQEQGGVTELGLLQFSREPEERERGHVVQRVYEALPERIGASLRRVVVDGRPHEYAVAPLTAVAAHLGDAWRRGEG
jgi:hypothetical protein